MVYISSTERNLHAHLDAKKEYAEFFEEFRKAREDRDVRKIETLIQEFIAETDARQIMELLQDPNTQLPTLVQIAEKFRKHYMIPPKQELDLGSITFSINRPAQVEGKEPKKIEYNGKD